MSTPSVPYTGTSAILAASPVVSNLVSTDHQVSVTKDSVPNHEGRVLSDLVDEEEENLSWTKTLFGRRTRPLPDPDAIATRRSVFDDPYLAPHYWPKKDYENIHRFDPLARWTYQEERALLSKVDWKIMVMAAIAFSALNLDRYNINQANSTSFLFDLGLTTDGNNCLTLPGEVVNDKDIFETRLQPRKHYFSNFILVRRITISTDFKTCWARSLDTDPDLLMEHFYPFSILAYWKIIVSYLPCITGVLVQGGFIPDMVLYMSYFYTKTELPIRLASFYMSSNFCAIIASFLAYGILHLDGVSGKAGWRWLFLIEGLITFAIGTASFFNMPPSPTQTKTRFRPNGWFTEREEVILVNKVLRDDPTKGDMHNREGLTLRRLWTAVCDYDLWPVYILGLMFGIPNTPPSTYLTLLLRNAGFSTFQTNLLTIPSQVLGIINMFIITLVSELVGERTIVAMIEDLWTLPFLMALYVLPLSPDPWIFFWILSGLLSFPHTHPIQVGWCSRNSGAVASRTVNASLYNMFVQASRIISAQIYVASDAPRYEQGNRILIIICSVNLLVLYPATKVYYIRRNRYRAKIWDAMTPGEKVHYLRTTQDVGDRRLDFRFAH